MKSIERNGEDGELVEGRRVVLATGRGAAGGAGVLDGSPTLKLHANSGRAKPRAKTTVRARIDEI